MRSASSSQARISVNQEAVSPRDLPPSSPANDVPAAGAAAIERFDFHGDRIDVVRLADGDVGVSLRRLCEAVPVDFSSQVRRLAREAEKDARWAVVVKMTTTGSDGKRYEMLVLPRRSIPMFAATISLGSVREDLRPGIAAKLARYQDECADVLADHFLGRRGPMPAPTLDTAALASALASAIATAVAPLAQRLAVLETQTASLSHEPVLGRAQARRYVLGPLLRAARMKAEVVGKEKDKSVVASLRQSLENQLREDLDFPRRRGHAWQNFPTARLGDACLKVARVTGDERTFARLAGKGTQLPLPIKAGDKPN